VKLGSFCRIAAPAREQRAAAAIRALSAEKGLAPALSTYLGHANLDSTSVYLSMTPELLHEASVRFDRYVNGGDHA